VCVPLVDSSHDGGGAPERQLGGEDDGDEEQVGLLELGEGRRVRLAQRVELVARHAADLEDEGVASETLHLNPAQENL